MFMTRKRLSRPFVGSAAAKDGPHIGICTAERKNNVFRGAQPAAKLWETAAGLTDGTSLERIGDESLTRRDSCFVHG
jgi:hypothetical protein